MRKIKDYDKVQSYKKSEQLPIGGYILEILNAKEEEGKADYPNTLIISFDIAEGPFKGFFKRNWQAQDGEDKKWKGTFRLRVPNEDGTEHDDWRKRAFKTAMECIEDSNEGYAWDWNEAGLKGLKVGGVFNQKEYEFNDRHGFFTQCKRFETVEAIEKNTFKQPDTDYLKNSRYKDPAPEEQIDNDDWATVPDDIAEKLPFA